MAERYRYIAVFLLAHWTFLASAQQDRSSTLDSLVTITEVAVSQDADTTRFDPILYQAPVAMRPVSQRLLDSLKADDDYWYANAVPVKKEAGEAPGTNRKTWLRQKWFHHLLWFVILGSFVGVVIWYLFSSNILIFRKKTKQLAVDEPDEVVTDDIFSIRYGEEIAKAAGAGIYRLAVRLWYLYTLKELAEKKWIDYQHGRTNYDYVMQLQKTAHYRDFLRLTRNFEYTWYGQFDLSAEAYTMLRSEFSTFQKGLRR